MTDRAAVDSRAEYGDEELAVEPRIARQPCSRTYPPIQSHSSPRAIIVGPAGQSGRFRTSFQRPNRKRLRSPWGGRELPGPAAEVDIQVRKRPTLFEPWLYSLCHAFARWFGFVWQRGERSRCPRWGTFGSTAGANNLGPIVGWAGNTTPDPTCAAPQVPQFRPVDIDGHSLVVSGISQLGGKNA